MLKMNKDILRMQMLSGVITESEYKAKLEEIEENKKLTTKAVREYWGEASNTDNPVSHPYGVTYEIYEYEGDTLGKLVDTAPYVDLFTTKDQAEDYINEFNSNSLEERNLEDQQFNWDMLYDENKEYRHNENKSKLEELGGGMSPKRVFKRAVVAKLNKIYNSVDNEELKQKLMDTINPTIDSIVNGKYGDDIGKYPMADLLDDLDDYLKSITQSIINQSSPKDSLNENFVGMGMVGNIFDREKTDYELAFEHFTKGTSLNEVEVEEEGAKWVQKLLNPHDYITLKAGTLLTIKRPPGFIEIPKETEAVYFGVNKFNQVEVAVRNDLGWNTGTVESGDIKELSSEEARAFMDSLNLEEGEDL